ncbi:unnamed protein product [Rotaria sp. Silwood2]|nr:unnamed protein product [Rotaria sp. Silwood2]CAF4113647.1 unnamed protein product [Rotaria sp. Silwood2]CAF4164288.1 unnamed protein product [Rotaria sp. Silwood2]CAF4173560.1 unnamed protein product [Rotaria sp. Silwood2]
MVNMDSNEEIDNQTSSNDQHLDIAIPFAVRFWLFLISVILSIACYLFVLCHLLFDRGLRRTRSNQTIIVLLVINIIYELTGIPLYLSYFHYVGNVLPSTPTYHRGIVIFLTCHPAHGPRVMRAARDYGEYTHCRKK